LAAYDYAIRQHGKLTLQKHLLDAAKIAEAGFPIDRTYARSLAATANELRQFAATRAIFLSADGQPWKEGEILKQRDLAKTYRAIAEHGLRWFYQGAFAEETGNWMKQNGGLLRAEDFRAYQIKLREPIITTYRGF